MGIGTPQGQFLLVLWGGPPHGCPPRPPSRFSPSTSTVNPVKRSRPSPSSRCRAASGVLVVKRGPNVGARYLLEGDVTRAGRHPESDIFLDDITVSRRHAELEPAVRRSASLIRDDGSLNGTYVNRERIEEQAAGRGGRGADRQVQAGLSRGGRRVSNRTYLSIGDVLSLLRQEFPDVTISKIRFLESQGLVNPERSPSGYRKFYSHDVERLRWVLRQQREHFLPLKVIRDRLAVTDGVPSDDTDRHGRDRDVRARGRVGQRFGESATARRARSGTGHGRRTPRAERRPAPDARRNRRRWRVPSKRRRTVSGPSPSRPSSRQLSPRQLSPHRSSPRRRPRWPRPRPRRSSAAAASRRRRASAPPARRRANGRPPRRRSTARARRRPSHRRRTGRHEPHGRRALHRQRPGDHRGRRPRGLRADRAGDRRGGTLYYDEECLTVAKLVVGLRPLRHRAAPPAPLPQCGRPRARARRAGDHPAAAPAQPRGAQASRSTPRPISTASASSCRGALLRRGIRNQFGG